VGASSLCGNAEAADAGLLRDEEATDAVSLRRDVDE
jgi:hypothetical protein